MNQQTVIFIGKSGSGKGTQANLLKSYLEEKGERKAYHLEAGRNFRKFISDGKTYASTLSKEINDTGELQPAFLSIWAWSESLIYELHKDEHLIIDGTPRRLIESQLLDEALQFLKREDIKIVHIKVEDQISEERLKNRGRSDDLDIRDISKRLEWFKDDVVPVVDMYRERNDIEFIEIDGSKEIEEVHKELLEALKI